MSKVTRNRPVRYPVALIRLQSPPDMGDFFASAVLLIAIFWLPFVMLRMNRRLADIHAELVKLNERLDEPGRKRSEQASIQESELRVSRMAGAFPGLDSRV